MTIDQLLWLTSRSAALAAFFVVAVTLILGQALRTALFAGWLHNRDMLAVHRFLTICWAPLIGLHVVTILLDQVARVTPLDVIVPFRMPYASVPLGLGTLGFDLLLAVTAASYLHKRLDPPTWRWIHRLTYVVFVLFGLHALLSGTDLAQPIVRSLGLAAASFVLLLSLARMLPARQFTRR